MYETGGRMNILGWLAVVVMAGILVAGITAELEKGGGIGKAVGIGASLIFWGYVAYRFISRNKR